MSRISVVPTPPALLNSDNAVEWNFHPELESEIITLAALCQAKQHQRIPLPSSTDEEEADTDEEFDEDGCTNHITPPNLDGNAAIKKGFLDRLAELICYKKDPSLITSTALIYSEMEATIVIARNSNAGQTWSDRDIKMLEYLAEDLEKISVGEHFDSDPLAALQNTLIDYYKDRIRHHAENLISLENGKTGMYFFSDKGCKRVLSGHLDVRGFVGLVEKLVSSVEFCTRLSTSLAPKKFNRISEELAHITRPMEGARVFLSAAQQCSGFRKIKIVLLNSPPAKEVKLWPLPTEGISVTPKQQSDFTKQVQKRKNFHAEMVLMSYLLGCNNLNLEVFPYLGLSKKTCLLCGLLLREIGFFKTRGNHGKCYSQWTFPNSLSTSSEVAEKLELSVRRLRDLLWDEVVEHDMPYRNAEKESEMAAPIPPNYPSHATLFNKIVEDPRLLAREAEWLSLSSKRKIVVNVSHGSEKSSVKPPHTQEGGKGVSRSLEGKNLVAAIRKPCAFCKATCELTHICQRCGVTAHCSLECYRSDWHRHKFSCRLGRPIDATDYLVLACYADEFPPEDVAIKYGFLSFESGYDRLRLFGLYRRLIVKYQIDEDELRSAVEKKKLKEMITYRCCQTRDLEMIRDMHWIQNKEGFGTEVRGLGVAALIEVTQKELLSPEERKVRIHELQPLEKRQALIFYAQIRNGFRPDVDEDNWISLGLCNAADKQSLEQLVHAYRLLVTYCSFNEFWNAMKESKMVDLFTRYELADQISGMRNFKDLMGIVKKRHQSVWELKRFTIMSLANPMRAVMVDYGFQNCKDPRESMQLREVYREYFNRGEDEMRLHEACVAGKLGDFLETVLGNLAVREGLLRNPYPMENFPLMGMVKECVTLCTESVMDVVDVSRTDDSEDVVVFPDSEYDRLTEMMQKRAKFLGIGVKEWDYLGSDGRAITCSILEQ